MKAKNSRRGVGFAAFLGAPAVQLLARLVLGGLFIYASVDKIAHPRAFADIIASYRLLPGFMIHLAAAVLPWLELIAGAVLIAGIWKRGATLLLTLLLAAFLLGIAVNAVRGLDLSCGCFSTSAADKENPWFLMFRDFLFLIPGVVILFFGREESPRVTPSSGGIPCNDRDSPAT